MWSVRHDAPFSSPFVTVSQHRSRLEDLQALANITIRNAEVEREYKFDPDLVVRLGTLSYHQHWLSPAKGRSGLIWWLISLLLGPIALLIIMLPRQIIIPLIAMNGQSNTDD